jgi:hypothetical protein
MVGRPIVHGYFRRKSEPNRTLLDDPAGSVQEHLEPVDQKRDLLRSHVVERLLEELTAMLDHVAPSHIRAHLG